MAAKNRRMRPEYLNRRLAMASSKSPDSLAICNPASGISPVSVNETTGWKPVFPDRQDACPPSENAAGGEVVEAAGDIREAVGGDLSVGAAVAGVDAVARIEVAEGFEGGVGVVEEFDEDLA